MTDTLQRFLRPVSGRYVIGPVLAVPASTIVSRWNRCGIEPAVQRIAFGRIRLPAIDPTGLRRRPRLQAEAA